jgi:hypothetical protein
VSALSPIASAALAAVLVASMARAFLGPPAQRPRRRAARALLAATAGCYLAGAALVVLAGATLAGAILVVAGIEAWDWDAFDRARAAWRGRPRAGV